jgi:hypothetical protein
MAGAMVRDLGLSHPSGKQEMVVSYLPLSHIAAQMMDMWIPIKIGALTFFAQPDALRVRTWALLHPNAALGEDAVHALDRRCLEHWLGETFSPSSAAPFRSTGNGRPRSFSFHLYPR